MFVVMRTVGILGGILSHVCCHDYSGHTGRTIESCLLSRLQWAYWEDY